MRSLLWVPLLAGVDGVWRTEGGDLLRGYPDVDVVDYLLCLITAAGAVCRCFLAIGFFGRRFGLLEQWL